MRYVVSGSFLGLAPRLDSSSTATGSGGGGAATEKVYENVREDPQVDEEHFEELLDNLDANDVLDEYVLRVAVRVQAIS